MVLLPFLIIAQQGGYHITSSFLSLIHTFCFVSFVCLLFKEVLTERVINVYC